MTFEVAILNKNAIALAADSKVTVGEAKTFASANKIFTLSKYTPVGIMIYGSATLLSTPWELLIKLFRKELGNTSLNTIKDYGDKFIQYLNEQCNIIPEEIQKHYFAGRVYSYFQYILKHILDKRNEILSAKKLITDKETKKIVNNTISEHYKEWRNAEKLPCYSDKFLKELSEKYQSLVKEIREQVFENLPISKSSYEKLFQIAINLFVKHIPRLKHPIDSGIIISGFGNDDIYPKLIEYCILGAVNNQLIYRKINYYEINYQNNSYIATFAQPKVVSTFIGGIDPDLKNLLYRGLEKSFNEYADEILEILPHLKLQEKDELKKGMRSINDVVITQFKQAIEKYQDDTFIKPLLDVVDVLPKDELALMAETLVNLTSFKHRLSKELETVGGPIDVAVISKGDGFVWIKRKHYFKAELNPYFFANYYRGGNE
ncbi:MAG: hypothetical protein ACTSYO_03330 [Candidatus Ranarchaeia archaeon]